MSDEQIPAKGQVPEAPEPGQPETVAVAEPSKAQQVLRDIMGGSAMISVLAVVLALIVGAILIALTD
jgi:simple sugar transport system permease protein